MTKIAKVLAVVTVVGCLLWMGFVMAALAGGPKWEAIADELARKHNYEFSQSEGENPVWSAKRVGPDTTSVGSDANLAKVIVAVQNHIKGRQAERLNGKPAEGIRGLQDQITLLEQQIAQTEQFATTDVQALEQYETDLTNQLTQLGQQITDTTRQIGEATAAAKASQDQATLRRGDVHRLRPLLQELQEDRDRLASLQQRLRDWIQQGRLDVEDLRERAEQAGLPTDAPAANGATAAN